MLITTVNDFFGIIDGRFWKEILAGEPGAKIVTDLTAQSAVNVSLDQWPTILSGVAEKAKDLLDVDLSWLIVSGWGKYGELTEYTIADGHNPRDTHLVPLRKHTMSVNYSPFLDLVFTGKPLGKVVFDVRMSFDLEGFVLTIQNNKILKIRTGSTQAKGQIQFKGERLVEKSLTTITLTKAIDLGEGVALPRENRAAN